jgi:ribosomal protein S18 acetylase RimI-like enzyme
VTGYALVVIETRPSLTCDLDDRRATIDELRVLPADRGVGVGSALIDAAKASVRAIGGLDRVSLGVLAADERAQRVYRRHGFTVPQL